jgi:hypothetical protein
MKLPPIHELKLRMLVEGIEITKEARDELLRRWGDTDISLADYATTNGIGLRLEDGVWVNAPVAENNPNFVGHSQHKLKYENGRFVAVSDDISSVAEPLPLPSFRKERNKWGEPYVYFVQSHADRVRVAPIVGCSFKCQFCDMPSKFQYRVKTLDRLLDATKRAIADTQLPVTHALLSGGTPKVEDISHQHMVYESIINAFPDFDFEIMLSPLGGLLDVPLLRSFGAKGLAINLELYGEEAMRKYSPEKISLGRDRFFDAIEKAVECFGNGNVRSLVLVGLEDLEETLKGVRALACRGCDPVLSAFRPALGTPLEYHAPPRLDFVREAYLRSQDIVAKYPGVEIGPRCVPCRHNSVAF